MASDMFTLSGKVVAVVGAGSGIGEAIALGAASQGASFVACLDLNEAAATKVAGTIKAQGGQAAAGVVDIANSETVSACFEALAQAHGRLDGVVCTPSINVRKPILAYTGDEFDRVVRVNLRGTFNVLQTVGRIMTAQHRALLVDPLDRDRAGPVRVLDDESGHSAAGEDRRNGVGDARRARERRGPGCR